MAERNPRIPHSIESLLFVNRNGKYCGYKQELISDNISADRREFLICAECKGISRKPRQKKGKTVCEVCVPGHSMGDINKRVGNTVASLNARCPLSGEGCDWEGKLGGIEQHMEECLKVRVKRQLECGISIERGTYEQDNREVRPLKENRCDYCNQKVQAKDENRHIRKCEYHPDTEVPCPYKELGCEAIVLRKNRGIHITENMDNHNKLMLEQIKQLNQLRKKNQRLERDNQQQENRNVLLERVNQQQKYRNQNLERINEQQENSNVLVERVNEQLKHRNEGLERISEQQKNINQNLERLNEQKENRNEELERINVQQKYRNRKLKRLNEQQENRNEELERINEQQKNKNEHQRNRNEKLERIYVQHENRNPQPERVDVQQKNKIEELERVNEQHKIRCQQVERINEQQMNRNQQLERINQQHKIRNQQLERSNEQQKIKNGEQQKSNEQLRNRSEILPINHRQLQSYTERGGEHTNERNRAKRRWRLWVVLALVAVGVGVLIVVIIGIAVAACQGNNSKVNSSQPETNANQPETNLQLIDSLLSNVSYIYKYIVARGKVLPGIEWTYNVEKTGTFYGPTFYLEQCKLTLKAVVTNYGSSWLNTLHIVERLEGKYDDSVVNCKITYTYTISWHLGDTQPEDTESYNLNRYLEVGDSAYISSTYWDNTEAEVIVRAYFDTFGI